MKMTDFEHRQLEIGLEFMRLSFAECYNFSKGSSEPKKDAQVIRVQGRQRVDLSSSWLAQLAQCLNTCKWIVGGSINVPGPQQPAWSWVGLLQYWLLLSFPKCL